MYPEILTVNLNPAWQKIYFFKDFHLAQVNRVENLEETAAGKGVNTARVLESLKASHLVCGYAGGITGELFLKNLSDFENFNNIAHDFVSVAGNLRTCTTLINQQNNTVTELCEVGAAITLKEKKLLHKKINSYLLKAKALIISGTIPPGEDADSYASFLNKAQKTQIISLLDATGNPGRLALSASPTIYKINKEELQTLLQKKITSDTTLKAEIKNLSSIYKIQTIIITNESHPIIAYTNNKFYSLIPPSVIAINPIGSGDAFNAGLIFQYLQTKNMPEALIFATANTLTDKPGIINLEDLSLLKAKVILNEVE